MRESERGRGRGTEQSRADSSNELEQARGIEGGGGSYGRRGSLCSVGGSGVGSDVTQDAAGCSDARGWSELGGTGPVGLRQPSAIRSAHLGTRGCLPIFRVLAKILCSTRAVLAAKRAAFASCEHLFFFFFLFFYYRKFVRATGSLRFSTDRGEEKRKEKERKRSSWWYTVVGCDAVTDTSTFGRRVQFERMGWLMFIMQTVISTSASFCQSSNCAVTSPYWAFPQLRPETFTFFLRLLHRYLCSCPSPPFFLNLIKFV